MDRLMLVPLLTPVTRQMMSCCVTTVPLLGLLPYRVVTDQGGSLLNCNCGPAPNTSITFPISAALNTFVPATLTTLELDTVFTWNWTAPPMAPKFVTFRVVWARQDIAIPRIKR